jgi:nucleoside-diphosphate-sugar epimerase
MACLQVTKKPAMKILIIGGTGHIGTYLVPRLVMAGHEVISVSRKLREPYRNDPAWKSVNQVMIDREEADRTKNLGRLILKFAPDAVIDLICFTPESAADLADSLNGHIEHFLHCGTIWVHGYSEQVPTVETLPRKPFGQYGINKAAIESLLLSAFSKKGFPVTILHPGHIVGPGWAPLNPSGHFNPEVFRRLADGKELILPNLGMETVHHVHADDVAQSFIRAIENRNIAIGESFHVVSEQALTLRSYAEAMALWFGQEARLRFLPWPQWKETVSEAEADATWDHIAHSPNCSILKAKKLLGYSPRYTSLEAVREAVTWLIENKKI